MAKIVLCVDDSATMQQVADITFRGTEFTYVGARNYDEGFDKAKKEKPVLVLVDAQMPGKSGYDLCLALKSNDATSNTPVVILCGNGAPYDNAKGIQVGADANLPKPWDTQTMLEKVTEIVGRAGNSVARPGQAPVAAAAAAAPPVAAAKSAPAVVARAPVANEPPRSATIMGMPTIKMPAGVAPPATPVAAQPSKTTVMAVPPISPNLGAAASVGPTGPAMRPPAAPPTVPAPAPAPAVAVSAASSMSIAGANRNPMISGIATKRSAIVERTLAKMAERLAEATGLAPGSPELMALLKLSTEVVERVVWEVVPDLAEQIIRENLHDLTARRS